RRRAPVHPLEGASPRLLPGGAAVRRYAAGQLRLSVATRLSLGLHCSQCCIGPMAILLAIGAMDVRAMAVVTAAITLDRILPSGERVAGVMGIFAVGTGLFLIVRAAVL